MLYTAAPPSNVPVKQPTLEVLTVEPVAEFLNVFGPTAKALAAMHEDPPWRKVGAGVGRTVGYV